MGKALAGDRTVRPLLEFGRELAAQAIAEIAFIDRAPRKLVGDFRRLARRSGAQSRRGGDSGGCERASKNTASADGHDVLLFAVNRAGQRSRRDRRAKDSQATSARASRQMSSFVLLRA